MDGCIPSSLAFKCSPSYLPCSPTPLYREIVAMTPPLILPPDETRGPLILGLGWTGTILCCLVTLLRIRVRFVKKAHGWDDCVIYTALVFIVACSIINIIEVNNGFGRHTAYIDLPTSQGAIIKWTTYADLFSTIGICLIKVSVCLFILRSIRNTNPRLRILLWFMIVLMTIITTTLCILFILQCRPFAKIWTPRMPGACWSATSWKQLSRAISGFDTATDLICLLIPLFTLHRLKIERKSKIALGVIIALGSTATACAIVKTILAARPEKISRDPTWDYLSVSILTMFELNLGYIVACLPALHPVLLFICDQASHIINRSSSRSKRYLKRGGFVDLERGIAPVVVKRRRDKSGDLGFDADSNTSNARIIGMEPTATFEFEYEEPIGDVERGNR